MYEYICHTNYDYLQVLNTLVDLGMLNLLNLFFGPLESLSQFENIVPLKPVLKGRVGAGA